MSDLQKPQILKPFTRFCMTIGNLPSSYLVSLTYEEQLLWLCDYIKNTVIPAVNNNAEALSEVQNLYIELKEYVDNYFTNLNVQQQIDNKLDEMAEDGTLENIINQQIFSNINNQINDLSAEVDSIQVNLQNNKSIFIGDSYSLGRYAGSYVNSWIHYFTNLLNLSSEDYYISAENGAGFVQGGNDTGKVFKDLLEDLSSTIADKNSIKNIFVTGGYNDAKIITVSNRNTLINNIHNFISYAKTNYPNATIYCGVLGNNSAQTNNAQSLRAILNNLIIPTYISATENGGGIYLSGVENTMHNYDYFNTSSDDHHPTQTGYERLGASVYNAFKTGYSSNVYYASKLNAITPIEGLTMNNTVVSIVNNDVTSLRLSNMSGNFAEPISLNGNQFKLGTYDINCFRQCQSTPSNFPILMHFHDTSNKYYSVPATISFQANGDVILNILGVDDGYITYSNINGFRIYPTSITLSTREC